MSAPWWRRDWLTDLGLAAVGLAAGVLTFVTWRDLAIACGVSRDLAWLVPLTVDAAGIVAARVWLAGTAPADAVRFARAVTVGAIALSIAGNAVGHAVDAGLLVLTWWVVVLVTAIPPATLGAVVHLGHLVRRGRAEAEPELGVAGASSGTGEAAVPPAASVEPEPAAELVAELAPATPSGPTPIDPLERAARELVAAGAGRPRLRTELGISDHQARQLVEKYRQREGASA